VRDLYAGVETKSAWMICDHPGAFLDLLSEASRRSPLSEASRRSPLSEASRRSPLSEASRRSPLSEASRRSPLSEASRRAAPGFYASLVMMNSGFMANLR
jgi:hypothetical protein